MPFVRIKVEIRSFQIVQVSLSSYMMTTELSVKGGEWVWVESFWLWGEVERRPPKRISQVGEAATPPISLDTFSQFTGLYINKEANGRA